MHKWLVFTLAASACAGTGTIVKRTHMSADLVLVGGTVYTMDPLRPRADAIAVTGGHIEATGTAAEIRAYIGPKTRVIELEGRAVTPGLVDGHAHLYGLGKS